MNARFGIIPLICATAMIPFSTQAQQGVITDIEVVPDPACRNEQVTILVHGTGNCQEVSVQADVPTSVPMSMTGAAFPVAFTHTYANAGTFELQAGSSHPQCGGGAQTSLLVESCNSIVVGAWLEHIFESLGPQITGGFGLVQPGSLFPIVVFGKNFGSQQGQLILEGDFGAVGLDVLEWGGDGKFASGYIPGGICGVFDHEATIKVVTSNGWHSPKWPVNFTAARDVKVFPRNEVQVLSCSHDSNKDCCNSECDSSDGGWFSACGSPNSSICGSHYNVWGAIGDDSGTDRYRVDLSDGAWLIENWDFTPNVDPGEGWAQLNPPGAFHEKSGDFEIDWLVTPNDDVFYDIFVEISGPCGTSHSAGVSAQALTGVIENMAGQQAQSLDGRITRQLIATQKRVRAEQIRQARTADQRAQQELVHLREAVTVESRQVERQRDQLRKEVDDLRAAGRGSSDSDGSLARRAEELLSRARDENADVRD